MTLPTTEEIIALHKKYAASDTAFDIVYIHCQIVWEIAQQLINHQKLSVDGELVKVGCLVHDIGVYKVCNAAGELDKANYLKHGLHGYNLLKNEGYSEAICRMASHHTGVGISKDDVIKNNLPLPPADYCAETTEEQLVMYADKFHSKDTPPTFLTPAAYARNVRRFGDDKVTGFHVLQEQFGTPNLQPLAEKYGVEIIP